MPRDALIEALRPALDLAWPGQPLEVGDLDPLLREARTRILEAATALAGADGFVPAALWTNTGREILLEHLRLDIAMLVGGVRAEGLWFAFVETPDTEPLAELIIAGMLIKLRAVGAFLVHKPSTRPDELTAAQFFPTGAWELARSDETTQRVLRLQVPVHKQVAHLTISRPYPDELDVYRPSTYRPLVEDLLALLEQFADHVDARLVSDGWTDSIRALRTRLSAESWL